MKQKITLSLVLVAAAALFFWSPLYFHFLTPQQKLLYLIQEDLKNLALAKALPESWGEISSIEVTGEKNDPRTPVWLESIELPIALKPDGNRHLEVNVFPWNVEGKYGAVINYHLIDRTNQNTVWEFGR